MIDLADKIASRKSGAVKRPRKPADPKRKLTTGRVLKYALLPDFGSRIRDLGKRLGGFAYFLAQIFYSCRLIPAGHPTLQSANIGYFGFSDVISTAAANLQIRKENADQIIMFGAVVVSMVLLVANGLAIAAYTVLDFGTAFAQDTAATAQSGSMFVAPHPETDLALIFLDRVFGTTSVPFFASEPGAYDSALGGNAIKEALYAMLGIYSTAMMVVAVVIVLYYAFVVVGESAMTGQPFGKRFNSFWAPIRLVVGLGLLVPIAGGLNAAQYITLYAAKVGSGLASYAWSGFTDKLAQTNLISSPEKPMVSGLVASIVRFETCAAVANNFNGDSIAMRVLPQGKEGTFIGWSNYTGNNRAELERKTVCGGIYIDKAMHAVGEAKENNKAIVPALDTSSLHDGYVTMVQQIANQVRIPLQSFAQSENELGRQPNQGGNEDKRIALQNLAETSINRALQLNDQAVGNFTEMYRRDFQQSVEANISKLDQYGWMGAGMFYNQIADLNGTLIGAVNNTFPKSVRDIKLPGVGNQFSQSENPAFESETSSVMTQKINEVAEIFGSGNNPEVGTNNIGKKGPIWWIFDYLLGGKNLENFRNNNPTNPLAELSAVGKGFVDKAWFLIVGAIMALAGPLLAPAIGALVGGAAVGAGASVVLPGIGTLGGGVAGAVIGAGAAAVFASVMKSIAGFLIFLGTIGLVLGIFLYYVIPLIPFLYFFFAITSWVLDVLEAMVGLPLWALAHIRIDGDGLSGPSANFGYTAILGIIIRPFIILFGMIIGIILFSAGMMMMHEMFSFYADSIHDGENTGVDYIAYSGVYTIMAYSLAMLCFKQSDQMPQSIMRWFGTSETRYNDGQADPAESMKGMTFAGAVVANQFANSFQGFADGIGGAKGSGKAAMAGKAGDYRTSQVGDGDKQNPTAGDMKSMGGPYIKFGKPDGGSNS